MNIWIMIRVSGIIALLFFGYGLLRGAGCDYRFHGVNDQLKSHVNIQCHQARMSGELVSHSGEPILTFEGWLFSYSETYFYLYLRDVDAHVATNLPNAKLKGFSLYENTSLLQGNIQVKDNNEAVVMFYRPERYTSKGRILGRVEW
ncbi:hypothetical protein [Shewanella atlantica]|uniref:Uncharacterized protein n=1 Tax=Shewanella atlantica TaxID=271099 RepID=A0A431VWX7_9GAMM|nr:hypothetical protein [Shewanella atlantica]RTR27713.1 hypothetical protein EKG39_20145 [Shewanella atlantica]